jgi:hypothetical protein
LGEGEEVGGGEGWDGGWIWDGLGGGEGEEMDERRWGMMGVEGG